MQQNHAKHVLGNQQQLAVAQVHHQHCPPACVCAPRLNLLRQRLPPVLHLHRKMYAKMGFGHLWKGADIGWHGNSSAFH